PPVRRRGCSTVKRTVAFLLCSGNRTQWGKLLFLLFGVLLTRGKKRHYSTSRLVTGIDIQPWDDDLQEKKT
ncbi:hypothetical protein, partial [Thiolapillus sp.]|uniref:hypothetical protein n=1 Tax=Thiolapillus sp. TaxID=2017437 RepID=UPI003AF6ECEA